jgi:hypothetical protein
MIGSNGLDPGKTHQFFSAHSEKAFGHIAVTVIEHRYKQADM